MKMKAKVSAIALVVAGIVGIVGNGCKSVPTTSEMYRASSAIGIATGMVANETKIDDETRNVVCEIVSIVSWSVPETNETFEAAWMPKAVAYVENLVKVGKLDEVRARLVLSVFDVVVQGIDYVFEVRYPKARLVKELVSAAVEGFSGGFLSVFKPVNVLSASHAEDFDREAYLWLKRRFL